jgi:PAS domain S-box-containing protein
MIFKNNQLSSRFKQVFHNTGFGIMIVDKNRDLIEVNPKFCDMLGYNKEELIGQNAEILHISNKTYKEFGEKAFNQVRNKKPVNLDWPFRKKNREKIWFRIAGDPVADKDEVLWTVVDITERIKAKDKIEQLASKLSKYLSPQVYQSIFSGKKNVKIEAYRKKLTVFFSDIKGFTEITDRLEPEVLSTLLNSYLNEMSQIALKYGGTIDKFVGDAILIFFGDPETKGEREDAKSCVLMALEMQERMTYLRSLWQDQGITNPLEIRIGINSGYCNVGNFGSKDRLDYTIIGGEVNLASRLESSAMTGQILISEETYALIKNDIFCEKKEEIKVKGIAHKIQTYQVVTPYSNLAQKGKLLKEEFDGFNLNINLNISKKNKVINSLEKILKKLKKNDKRNSHEYF